MNMYTLINLILGLLVIGSYIYIIPLLVRKGISIDQLWVNISKKTRNIFYFSMILSAISYFYIYFYYRKKKNNLVTFGTILFLSSAILWSISIYLYFFKNKFPYLVITSLTLTSLGMFLILVDILNSGNTLLIICGLIIFIHVFLFDNIIWGYYFKKLVANS